MPDIFLSRGFLDRLAPGQLPAFIDARYDGGGQSASVKDFSPADSDNLRRIYNAVYEVCDVLRALTQQPTPPATEVEALKQMPHWQQILAATKRLGDTGDLPEVLLSIVHDVRGGSLFGLIGSIHLLDPATATPNEILRIFCYARDHLKIMRNCLPDIDAGRSRLDAEPALHPTSLYKEKWSGARLELAGHLKHVTLACEFDGYISTRCQEFSAIDRIIYNLFNNAARYGEGSGIQINIFVPPGDGERNVRFTVQNQVSALQAEKIRALTSGNLGGLLRGGASTSGSGLGLRICADFVTRAFGLRHVDKTIAGRYLGVELAEGIFVAWFHWPQV